ncbi:MAG: hypothetical protein LBN05_08155 [Oscillospiraceae bacterium]|jgi:hypothetical protein|nr:hypothetical protein [Oscillospiraceae bacterium]
MWFSKILEVVNAIKAKERENEIKNVAPSALVDFLFDALKSRTKTKDKQKKLFFRLSVLLLFLIFAGTVAIFLWFFCNLDKQPITETTDMNAYYFDLAKVITAMLAAVGTLITALIKLPEIVAQYLFDKEENAKFFETIDHAFQRIANKELKQLELDAELERTKIEHPQSPPEDIAKEAAAKELPREKPPVDAQTENFEDKFRQNPPS